MVRNFRRFVQLSSPGAFLGGLVLAAAGLFPTAAFAVPESSEVVQLGEEARAADSWAREFAAQRQAISEAGLDEQMCEPSTELRGSLADILTSASFDNVLCETQRSFYSLSKGLQMKATSAESGGDCRVISLRGKVLESNQPQVSDQAGEFETKSMNVCFSDASGWAQRGGTTYGNTFLTSATFEQFMAREDKGQVLEHEYRHYYQWRLLGPYFPAAYLMQGTDACSNVFERAAGLGDGGYVC